jgi:uncharacterized protein YegP (UPF0339 family)
MGFETRHAGRQPAPDHAGPASGQDRFLERADGGYASNDDRRPTDAPDPPQPMAYSGNGHFEVFREDEVSVSSTQFVGGGWRWRLSDGEGLVIAQAGDYPSEAACRAAIAAIQAHAALASVR